MKPFLTIFTPTYNRAYILPQLYDSLCRQTSKNFEWIIVDDGSSDNTNELVNVWENNTEFTILYIYQENAGKMAAHNRGVDNAKGELFVCVDSDDYISDDCVELVEKVWEKCDDSGGLGGIIAYKRLLNHKKQMVFPDQEYMSMFDLFHSGFSGDTTIILQTSVFKEFPFPILKGEKFITEAYVYNQISQKYKVRLMPEYLTICKYLPDGYTENYIKLFERYPGGWALYKKQCFQLEKGYKIKMISMAEYICFSRQYGKGYWKILRESPNMLMCLLCYPLGLYFDYKYRHKLYKDVN